MIFLFSGPGRIGPAFDFALIIPLPWFEYKDHMASSCKPISNPIGRRGKSKSHHKEV